MTRRSGVPINEKGRVIGEDHPNARLSDQDVLWILELHFEHRIGYGTLAGKFEVSKSTVRDICTGRTRAQIPTAYRARQRCG